MTVCVVAIADGIIVGAADRMLTAGDIEFEPTASKVRSITSSIVMMFSGDASFHREVADMTHRDAMTQIETFPEVWLDVRYVVDRYVANRNTLKAKAAEAFVLAPLGMTLETFRFSQAAMHKDLVSQIASDLVYFQMPSASCIIAGIDDKGSHIYTIENGTVSYHNATAFAAIGIGHWHAESELMTSGHSALAPVSETVSLVYRAKRRAETAPGVGTETDMFIIGGIGRFDTLNSSIQEKLKVLYDQMLVAERAARENVHRELDEYVNNLPKTAPAARDQEAAADDAPEPAPTDGRRRRKSSEKAADEEGAK